MPLHSPASFGWEKPARPVWTPHCRNPLALTSSRVAAPATPVMRTRAAPARAGIIACFIGLAPCCPVENTCSKERAGRGRSRQFWSAKDGHERLIQPDVDNWPKYFRLLFDT